MLRQALCIISKPLVNWNWCYSPEMPNSGQNCWLFTLCDLQIWWMFLKNNRVHILCCVKLCASFRSLQWIQSGVIGQKCSIQVKIVLSRVTMKFDGWPWKTIGRIFYATSSYVHHVVAIGELKLELQSGNSQFGSKLPMFCPMLPWNLIYDLEKPLLCYFKLCTSFCSHSWIYTGVRLEMLNSVKNW